MKARTLEILVKIFIIILSLACGGGVIFLLTHPKYLYAGVDWIKSIGIWGDIVVTTAFVIISFPFAMGYTELAMASGFVYGMLRGCLIVFIGSPVLGSAAAFWACRTVGKAWVERKLMQQTKFRALINALRKNAFKIILLCRLTPIPFGMQNAVFAVSGLDFKYYWIATWIGMAPELVIWVYFGTSAGTLEDIVSGHQSGRLKIVQKVLFIVGLVIAVAVIGVLVWIGKRAMKKAIAEEESTLLNTIASDDNLEQGVLKDVAEESEIKEQQEYSGHAEQLKKELLESELAEYRHLKATKQQEQQQQQYLLGQYGNDTPQRRDSSDSFEAREESWAGSSATPSLTPTHSSAACGIPNGVDGEKMFLPGSSPTKQLNLKEQVEVEPQQTLQVYS